MRAHRAFRLAVRIMALAAVLLLLAFVYLRVRGVPGFVLREAVRRANGAGIPVDVDGIRLTLRGWRAEGVRYYSRHPDDLQPMFEAREVFFDRSETDGGGTAPGSWKMDVKAYGVTMHPSVQWGMEIPEGHACRQLEEIEASLAFLPDRVGIKQGKLRWLGCLFRVEGTIPVSLPTPHDAAPGTRSAVMKPWLDGARFASLEERLALLQLSGGVVLDVDFSLDVAAPARSWIEIDARVENPVLHDVAFKEIRVVGGYRDGMAYLDQAVLARNSQSLRAEGRYTLGTGLCEGRLENTLESPDLLRLLPRKVLDLLREAKLEIGKLPRLYCDFGPCPPRELADHVAGAFSSTDLALGGTEIKGMRGALAGHDGQLEFKGLQCRIAGQEYRSAQTGSSMRGGLAEGEVCWDFRSRELFVQADGHCDPLLAMEVLSFCEEATNVIDRFRFSGEPPKLHIRLYANVEDWDTLRLDIQGSANDLAFHGVPLSSLNAAVVYEDGVVVLDPVAALRDADFLKGSATLDFNRHTASFDALGTLPPDMVEDLIYAELGVFGKHIRTAGAVRYEARGTVDWRTMRATDFSASVEAAQVEIPVARMDAFSAKVAGQGPRIAVEDARFAIYGGEGKGRFSIQIDPDREPMPYRLEADVKTADFAQCLLFLNPDCGSRASGKMSGSATVEADMRRGFFATANGGGNIVVENGQLSDLPLFHGFSNLIRRMIPSFSVFSIQSLKATFRFENGTIFSDDLYLDGDVLSAKGQGSYAQPAGFDAVLQAQIFSENRITKVIRVITDPIFKIFEIRLEGTLRQPRWRLDNLSTATKGKELPEEASKTD